MSARVLGAVERIVRENPDRRVLVVSHGGPIRAIHAAALGLDVQAYRRTRPVEPNARLSAVCAENGGLTELWPASRIDEVLARDQEARRAAAAQPPSPAG
jgi:broad specificity phosphatase PhoE